jgi:hypothetical protein
VDDVRKAECERVAWEAIGYAETELEAVKRARPDWMDKEESRMWETVGEGDLEATLAFANRIRLKISTVVLQARRDQ